MASSDFEKEEAFKDTLEVTFQENEETYCDDKIEEVESLVDDYFDNFATCMPPLTSFSEVRGIIKKLQNRKAAGLDQIPNIAFKYFTQNALTHLTKLYNQCLIKNHFPTPWKQANVIMLAKPNQDRTYPHGYRPISLINATAKIFERIILTRIKSNCKAIDCIPPEQCGFLEGHSTLHQLIRVTNIINEGFSANFILTFRVRLNNSYSNTGSCLSGVPQRSVLSPYLYNIYTHDFPQHSTVSTCLFADDSAVLSQGVQLKYTIKTVQHFLDNLETWLTHWRIAINVDKSQAIVFRKWGVIDPPFQLTLFDDNIQWVPVVKYLGLHIDSRLTFKKHIDYLSEKFWGRISLAISLVGRRSPLSLENKVILYKQILRPVITYGSPVWGAAAATHMKKVQLATTPTITTNWKDFRINLNNNFSLFNYYPNNINNTNDLETKITEFTEAVVATHSHASQPIVNARRNYTPNHINQLIKHKNNLRKRYQQTLNPFYKTLCNRAQANLKKELKIYSNDTWNARLEALNTTDNSLWEAQRFLKNKRSQIPTLNCATGMAVTDPQKANLLANTIKNNFIENNRMQDNYDQDDEVVTSTVNTFLSSPPPSTQIEPAMPDEIINFIKNTSSKKAPDHNPVFLNFNFKLAEAPPNPRAVSTDWKTFRINLNKNLSLFDFHPNNINNTNDLEQKITEFTEAVIDTHSHASRPIETERRNFTPHNINQLIKIKNYFRKRYHQTLNPIFKSHYNRAQSDLKKELKKYNDIIWQKRLEALNTADNSLWRTQKFFKNKRPKIPPLNCATGTAVTDQQKANLLATNMKNNFVENDREDDNYHQNDELINTTVNNFLSTP
ncbi:RNA-directed DNA polymerase from mobile element jockey [Trichonephila clavipes]|nr:RNA-directed DNA polymerase from mobile element jockey [Trichonephila clavipes]